MKKQILVISTLIFIVLLSACGGQPTQPPLEAATATEAVVSPTQAPATATALPTSTTGPVAEPAATQQEPIASVSFANHVLPIFNNSCIKCHGVEQVKEGLDLRSYDTLMAGSFNGSVITPGNAADSYLAEQVINGEMPNRGPDLTAEQIQIIVDWINAGALNN